MASFNAYPPSVLHPSPSSNKPIPISTAHTILTTFLHLANLDPAYCPDSTLSERGPESHSSTGTPNLTLHHLKRIKLGLEGTNLGAEDLDAGFFAQERKSTDTRDQKKRTWHDRDTSYTPLTIGIPEVISTAGEDAEAVLTAQDRANKAAEGDGWQDREDFELAQGDEDVDMNNAQRDPAAAGDMDGMENEVMERETGNMSNVDEQRAEEMDGQSLGRAQPLTAQEKAERKKQKKLRSKQELRLRNAGTRHEEAEEPSKMEDGNEIPTEKTSLRRRKKSKVEGQPRPE